MTAITLPWPDAKLSPNARTHWRAKAPVTKAARTSAYWLTEASGARVAGEGVIALRVVFHAPDNRHRDRDNVQSACKAYMDGIADALKVNDRRFEPTYAWGDNIKGGCVVVTL